jgi:hypothetical protein
VSKHITEWLNAYLDGELKGGQLQRVETHLTECQDCQAELESLQSLSGLLHEVQAPEFISSERFAAQVNLRLPQRRLAAPAKKVMEIGWWMIPVGLLGSWIFMGTLFFMNELLSIANRFGLPTYISGLSVFGSSNQAYWSATLGQFGILSGKELDWAATTEVFTRTFLPLFTLHVAIALLYLSWLAIWWALRKRREHGQLFES